MSELPAGLRAAPLARSGAAEVTRVWRACELHDDGEPLFTEEDFVAVWQVPSFDAGRETVGVRDGDALVALAILHGERQVWACVLPEHRGRGIGAWLLAWAEAAGRAAGHALITQTLPVRQADAIALLEAAGYERRWDSWIFEIELEREPEAPALPAGYLIRGFVPGRDDRAVHRVIEDAFGEWPDAEAWPYDDWAAETLRRPGFAAEHVAVVSHGEEIVGAAVLIVDEGPVWVGQLAVARPHRGRGLARGLLVHAFGLAWRSGCRRCGLSTDSRTGARALYEHVGMHVERSFTAYAKPL